MTCLIIDDNALARLALRNLLEDLENVTVVAECDGAPAALNILQRQPIDLLLLDVEMPKMNGLEMIEALARPPLVILVTSKADYALEAIRLQVVDYLLKPVQYPRLVQAIERARERLAAREPLTEPDSQSFIFVRTNRGFHRVDYNDILYLQAMGDYVNIVTADRKYPILSSLKDLLERLPADRFVRTHRSYAVSLQHVHTIEDSAILMGRESVPISDSYRAEVYERLGL